MAAVEGDYTDTVRRDAKFPHKLPDHLSDEIGFAGVHIAGARLRNQNAVGNVKAWLRRGSHR